MAVSRAHTWNSGDVLTASDLNGEFNNILNNGTAVAFPLTAPVSFAGFASTNVGNFTFASGGLLTLTSGSVYQAKGADLTAAATVTFGTDGNFFHITGNTGITAFASLQAGTTVTTVFTGTPTLTHNATTLILPGAANITVAAGDTAVWVSEGAGNWRCLDYIPAGAYPVNRGGTGNTSATAYAVQCGGTTSTAALQSVASVGTSGQVLLSGGAGALPQFGSGAIPVVAAGGTADAITATYTPAVTLANNTLCAFVATAANATTTPSFAPNGLTAHTITKKGGSAVAANDIPGALAVCIVCYNLANTRWELLNPAVTTASGTLTAGTPAVQNPWTASTTTTQAHGLASAPTLTVGYYECLTAEGNYSIGDRIWFSSYDKNVTQSGSSYTSNATNTYVISSGTVPEFLNKTTQTAFAATAANWKVVVTSYIVN